MDCQKSETEKMDALGRKELKRELRAEAMTRLEEAARSEADFKNVVSCWDKLDANRERKERYHEVGRSEVPLEYGSAYEGAVFPQWMAGPNYTAIRQGRYLDVIFHCPDELHQMVGHSNLVKIFRDMAFEDKDVLFFLIVREWSTAVFAEITQQSDRNVRKKRTRLIGRIRDELYAQLKDRGNLSLREKEFLAEYEEENVRCAG